MPTPNAATAQYARAMYQELCLSLRRSDTGLPGGILGYQIDLNLVSKLLIWYPLFLFGILQKFGIRSPQIWYPTTDLVSLGEQSLLSKKLMLWICC